MIKFIGAIIVGIVVFSYAAIFAAALDSGSPAKLRWGVTLGAFVISGLSIWFGIYIGVWPNA